MLLWAAILVYSFGNCAGRGPVLEENVIRGVDQAQVDREIHLTGYSGTERYILRNSRFQTGVEMTIAAVYTKGTGKSYTTLSRSGSSTLLNGVLDKLLREEAEMSRGETRQHALVNSANYKMRLIGEESLSGRQCEVLELIPRTKSTHLLDGRAWVDAEDQSLVRIEGKPSASLSFWTGRPLIVREYEKIDGFSLARVSHAVSDSFLLGKTELTIEYSDYTVTETAK